MSYKYHVFLSYRNHQQWPRWVEKVFLPIFEHWLGEALGMDAQIFWDRKNIESGDAWKNKIIDSVTTSQILVPLWSKQYFTTEWCRKELALMCLREEHCGFFNGIQHKRLIVPAVIYDGEDVPDYAKEIQYKNLIPYNNPFMIEGTETWSNLSAEIQDWTKKDIMSAIENVRPFNPEWHNLPRNKRKLNKYKHFFFRVNHIFI